MSPLHPVTVLTKQAWDLMWRLHDHYHEALEFGDLKRASRLQSAERRATDRWIRRTMVPARYLPQKGGQP